ncbi:MAG: preprotein translocase subunit Sec61beta [Candidatus Nezhaarchaeales archaeon]
MPKKVKTKSTTSKGSRSRRGRSEFTPIAGAGLIRFFKEETGGISVSPYIVIIIAVILIVLVLALPILLPL